MAKDVQLEAVLGGLKGLTEKVVMKITLDATANLKETTPVDTGWARANWVPSIGAPLEAPVGSVEEAAAHKGKGTFSNPAQGRGEASILSYQLEKGKTFISNNVPYIGDLNDGHSRKAPSGFVQMAIEKAVRFDLKGDK